jgi:hypothetical protein
VQQSCPGAFALWRNFPSPILPFSHPAAANRIFCAAIQLLPFDLLHRQMPGCMSVTSRHIADRYFFLYIYHKSLIQSKVTFLLNPARRTILYMLYVLCN